MEMSSEDLAKLGAAFMDAIEDARAARKAVRKDNDRRESSAILDRECFAAHRKIGLLLHSLVDADNIGTEIARNMEAGP